MKRYKYRLRTLSCLALSPRDHQGFYLAANEFKKENLRISGHQAVTGTAADKVKIIYPFYQYGTYPKYDPKHTDYYIPGSSIKGALLANESKSAQERVKRRLMVDDIPIQAEHLHLHRLYKVQNMSPESKTKIKLEVFFPNVAVEMLSRGCEYDGEMFGDGEYIRECLKNAQTATRGKLEQLVKLLKPLTDEEANIKQSIKQNTDTLDKLRNMIENIEELMNDRKDNGSYILLLGGFKGLALSRELTNMENVKSGIYVDHVEGSYLPHGLVRIFNKN